MEPLEREAIGSEGLFVGLNTNRFHPLYLCVSLPLAALLHMSGYSGGGLPSQDAFGQVAAMMAVMALACMFTLLLFSLAPLCQRSGTRRVLLLPAVLLTGVAGALRLPLIVEQGQVPLWVSAALLGVGGALLILAWAQVFSQLGPSSLFVASAACIGLAGCFDGALTASGLAVNDSVLLAGACVVSALALEYLLVAGTQSSGADDSGEGLGVPGQSGAEARPFRASMALHWKPFTGLVLCWVIFACTWGTFARIGAAPNMGSAAVFKDSGIVCACTVLLLTGLFFKDDARRSLMLKYIPVGATALLLLSWFLVLISVSLASVSQALVGLSLGALTVQTWAALCAAPHLALVRGIVGKAGALGMAVMVLFAGLAYMLGNAAEFVSPLLVLGYLVIVNFNLGTLEKGGQKVQAAKPALEPRLDALATTHGLSPREREVLAYLANGLSARYIAATLCISLNSVKTHSRHLYQKLGIHKRDELIALVNATEAE